MTADYIIYTDGACSGNPGPGGWACLIIHNGSEKILSGFDPSTTNNRMEMQAVIAGLEAVDPPAAIEVRCDSAYVVNAFNQGWIDNWLARNWTRGPKPEPVLNRDLWEQMIALARRFEITWVKVKGHSGDANNDKVDQLAVAEYRKAMKNNNKEKS